jgi:hypothetical protein
VNLRRNRAGGAILVLALAWNAISVAEAANLYRYRNDQGVLVIDHTVPAGAAQRGYEILGPDGKVIETVPPAGAAAAPAARPGPASSAEQRGERDKLDRYLLTSYSSVADIEAVKARRIEEVAREIGVIEVQLGELGRRRMALEERAANLQRGGKPVPEELMAELATVAAQATQARQQLAERQLQRTELAEHYDAYARRFTELKTPAAAATPAAPAPAAPIAPATAR